MKTNRQRVLLLAVLALTLLLPNIQTALAAPPSNDSLRRALEIDELPFVHREDTSEATASGPRFCGNTASVFFVFTPTEDVSLQADTMGSDYSAEVAVFTGERGDFERIACGAQEAYPDASVRFDAQAGTTYYFEVSACCGSSPDSTGGKLEFALSEVFTGTPEVTLTVDRRATLHPGRLVRVSGTVTCNERLQVEVFGSVRQLGGDFVARGFFDRYPPVRCDPRRPRPWKAYVDTFTGVAFGEGSGSFRVTSEAFNGYEYVNGPISRGRLTIAMTAGG